MLARKLINVVCISALALLLVSPRAVQAAPIQSQIYFNTVGSIDDFGVSGTPVVSFQGAMGSIASGSPFSIGSFTVSAPPSGTTTTYTNIPFQILFKTEAVNGAAISPNDTPVVLTGMLNGTVSAGTSGSSPQSTLTATFDAPTFSPGSMPPYPVNVMPFQTGNLMNFLSVTNSSSLSQPVEANLITSPVPEPSSIAIFAGLAGLGLWQRRRSSASK